MFAIATMIIYVWGLLKQRTQTKDLTGLLFSNGQARVKKYLKKNDSITIEKVEELSENLTAKFPFSQNKAVVVDTNDFAKKLLQYMVKTGQLEQQGNQYNKIK